MEQGATNINDSFFQGSYKELWKKIIPPGLTEAECDFIEEITGIKPGENVLDIMCGYGRHALQLGRRGYRVFAFDNVPDYVAEINLAAEKEALDVKAIKAGALEVELPETYKAAILMGNSFAFFTKADTIFLLKKIAAHLDEGGMMIINSYMIAEIAMRHFKQKEWSEIDGYKYLMNYTFHFHPSRIESEHTVIMPDGKIEELKGIDYIFSINELEEMFTESGFQLTDIFATPRKRKFKMGDNVSYLVIQKIA